MGGYIIPKTVKCTHSAIGLQIPEGFGIRLGFVFEGVVLKGSLNLVRGVVVRLYS